MRAKWNCRNLKN